jgi:hypothetical protein
MKTHKIDYIKWESRLDSDVSLRFFSTFDDHPEYVDKFVLKSHSTKEYTIVPKEFIDEITLDLLFNSPQHVEGYYENNQYVKMIDGVQVTEPSHSSFKEKKGKNMNNQVDDMTNPNIVFWMVYGKNPPKHKHYTQKSAIIEAKRLSSENPGVIYYVLQSVDAYMMPVPEPQKVELYNS